MFNRARILKKKITSYCHKPLYISLVEKKVQVQTNLWIHKKRRQHKERQQQLWASLPQGTTWTLPTVPSKPKLGSSVTCRLTSNTEYYEMKTIILNPRDCLRECDHHTYNMICHDWNKSLRYTTWWLCFQLHPDSYLFIFVCIWHISSDSTFLFKVAITLVLTQIVTTWLCKYAHTWETVTECELPKTRSARIADTLPMPVKYLTWLISGPVCD